MKNLIKAVLSVMEECKGIEKSMTVGKGQHSYKGVSDKDVKILVGQAMQKHKLVILPTKVTPTTRVDQWEELDTWSKEDVKPMKRKQSIFTEVITEYLLAHESGESVTLAGLGHGVDPQDKGSGKATTYALKYTLLYTFLVATGHIDDSDNTHSNDSEAPKVPPSQQSTPAEEKSNKLTSDRFKKAIVALKGGKTTLDKITIYSLTPTQLKELNAVKKELKLK